MYDEKEIKIKKPIKEKKDKSKAKTSSKPNLLNKELFQKINWKSLIIKLIIVFAVMFLIIFTISRINKDTKKESLNNSQSFEDNLNYLSSKLLDYYNINKLPRNNGDSLSFLLKELVDFNIIEEIKPNDTDNYDAENSYVIITKENAEYFKLRLNLQWNNHELSYSELITCNNKKCQLKK